MVICNSITEKEEGEGRLIEYSVEHATNEKNNLLCDH